MDEILTLNADPSQTVVVDTAALDWRASPSPTVWRKRLSLSGTAEAGVVTSIVRYDADSRFAEHGHPDGEEFFVLEGTFSDEHSDYPAGTYVLNPEGHRHAPFSREGCMLFVKLCQYGGAGREQRVIDTEAMPWQDEQDSAVARKILYQQPGFPERVALVRIQPGAGPFPHAHPGGEEFLVLDGELEDEYGTYPAGTWQRAPAGSRHAPFSTAGCTILARSGFITPHRNSPFHG